MDAGRNVQTQTEVLRILLRNRKRVRRVAQLASAGQGLVGTVVASSLQSRF